MTSADDTPPCSSLSHHCDRFRGDWFACSSLIASVAEQVGQRCSEGDSPPNVTLESISIGQLGQAVLDHSASADRLAVIDVAHLPPEQLEVGHATPAPTSHVYSIGVVFYHLLCGRAPFASAHVEELKRQIQADLPQPPRQLVHSVPTEVERVCLRAIEKDESRRYSTPQAFADALRKLLSAADDSVGAASASVLATPPPAAVVERRLMAVLLCKPSPDCDDQSGVTDASWIRSTIEGCLGASRVQTAGERLLIDAGPVDGASTSKLLADIMVCMSAVNECLSRQDSSMAVEFNSRLITGDADFADIKAEGLQYSATGLRARIDDKSIQLSADSRATLRRWLDLSDQGLPQSAENSVVEVTTANAEAIAETPFVGREPQLGLLKSRWMQILEGKRQVVLVVGDEGTGKSRLLTEFEQRTRQSGFGFNRIPVCCRPQIRSVAYECLAETYRELGQPAADGGVAGASVASSGEAEDSDSVPLLAQLSSRRTRKEAALTSSEKVDFGKGFQSWLHSLAEASPVLFLVEDIQWADPATLDFLQSLVTAGQDGRILTVMVCRSEFETPWGSHPSQSQIAMPSLSKRHISQLLSNKSADELPSDEFVRAVKKITKGIPSLIEGVRDGIIPA